MGRSRSASRAADEDANQRAKRKKIASGAENVESASAAAVQGISEGKVALYHCNYCNKDISGKIRIKCAACPDFDLCIECFSVGAEVTPHKSNHPYRIMDNLSFPLICPDWNVDEEMLLLEGIEMYGFSNWAEVADYVGTKSKSQCIDHYNAVYMNSPCYPIPDLSHVKGKTREELVAMSRGQSQVKQEFSLLGEIPIKEEATVSARTKFVESMKEVPTPSSTTSTAGAPSGIGSSTSNAVSYGMKKSSNIAQIKDPIKEEEPQLGRSIGEKKPRAAGDKGPSMTELSGFNFKRQEFEIEYDNDAEQLLAEMEFRETDTDSERELKLQVLRLYLKRLDERKRRKEFILERNLLYGDPLEKNLSPEELEIYNKLKVFMRFHSKEEHEELLRSIIEEHQIVKRIEELQAARAAGCRTAGEAKKFIGQKKGKETEESSQRVLMKPNYVKGEQDGIKGFHTLSPCSLDDWDITGFPGADLLSVTEKRLCGEIRILPAHYLKMLQVMSTEMLRGNLANKSDAHSLFRVDPSKVDRVYDMLLMKGVTRA